MKETRRIYCSENSEKFWANVALTWEPSEFAVRTTFVWIVQIAKATVKGHWRLEFLVAFLWVPNHACRWCRKGRRWVVGRWQSMCCRSPTPLCWNRCFDPVWVGCTVDCAERGRKSKWTKGVNTRKQLPPQTPIAVHVHPKHSTEQL